MTSKKTISQLDLQGNPNIGLFSFSSDSLCITGRGISDKDVREIEEILKTDIIRSGFLGTDLAGIFIAGNSKGIIVSSRLDEDEILYLKEKTDVLVLDSKETAIGNLILANDKGCVISETLKKFSKDIENFLGVTVKTGKIAGINLVGSMAAASNKGCMVHPDATDEELKSIQDTLSVPADRGAVNFGGKWIGSGLMVNSNGFIAGKDTTGPEMGHIAEVFGFV